MYESDYELMRLINDAVTKVMARFRHVSYFAYGPGFAFSRGFLILLHQDDDLLLLFSFVRSKVKGEIIAQCCFNFFNGKMIIGLVAVFLAHHFYYIGAFV